MTAIAAVSEQSDWKTAVKSFVQLHTDLVESYRDTNWRNNGRSNGTTEASKLQDQIDQEIARVELALDRAERRRDWAIVDLVFERHHMKKELEKRRAQAVAVA